MTFTQQVHVSASFSFKVTQNFKYNLCGCIVTFVQSIPCKGIWKDVQCLHPFRVPPAVQDAWPQVNHVNTNFKT